MLHRLPCCKLPELIHGELVLRIYLSQQIIHFVRAVLRFTHIAYDVDVALILSADPEMVDGLQDVRFPEIERP